VLQTPAHAFSPSAVWHVGGRDDHGQQQPSRIAAEMALTAIDLCVGIGAVDPPFSVVWTDGLSLLPALGWRCRPAAARTSPRRRSWSTSHVPSLRQCQT
jgi:hypothetical protein